MVEASLSDAALAAPIASSTPAEQTPRFDVSALARWRHGTARGGWSSTMGEADLACLLQVLEEQVLPRLISDYRPADRSPLRSRGHC